MFPFNIRIEESALSMVRRSGSEESPGIVLQHGVKSKRAFSEQQNIDKEAQKNDLSTAMMNRKASHSMVNIEDGLQLWKTTSGSSPVRNLMLHWTQTHCPMLMILMKSMLLA